MILDRLVQTNLLVVNNNPNHSVEAALVSLTVVVVASILFLFWKKRQALLNFQAWALLIAIINAIFFFHYLPLGPHILVHIPGDSHALSSDIINAEYQFTPFAMVFLRFLEFITSAITIWRLWKISEEYIPMGILYNKPDIHHNKQKGKLLARSLAIWHTLKNGGNHIESRKKIKKEIKKRILASNFQ
jgi:hypothetical protein